jgi:hypothetical protein
LALICVLEPVPKTTFKKDAYASGYFEMIRHGPAGRHYGNP